MCAGDDRYADHLNLGGALHWGRALLNVGHLHRVLPSQSWPREEERPGSSGGLPPQRATRRGARAKLDLSEKKPRRELLKVHWKKLIDATVQNDFVDSEGGIGGASLCLYRDAGNLIQRYAVDPDDWLCGSRLCWKALGPKGFLYKDKGATSDGGMKILLLAGSAGRGMAQATGKNNAPKVQTSPTTGIVGQLSGEPAPTIQLVTDAGFCLTATTAEVRKDDGVSYQAPKK